MIIGQYVGAANERRGMHAEVKLVESGLVRARFLGEDEWREFPMREFVRIRDSTGSESMTAHAKGPLVIVHYPPGEENGVPNIDIARELVRAIHAGATGFALPRHVDVDGRIIDAWRLFAEPTQWEVEVLRPRHNESGTESP